MARAGFDHEKTPIVALAAFAGRGVPKARLTLGTVASLVAVAGALMAGGLFVLDRFYAGKTDLATLAERIEERNGASSKSLDDHEDRLRVIERHVARTDANLDVLMRRMGAQPLPAVETQR